MSSDKNEAAKAKELAEKKFAEGDLNAAKRFALRAQSLYSELNGLHQLLATLDVHIAARERIHGVVDWYKVLGVEPLADDDTIKKGYKKMALILHPDKNKSIGADGAFKFFADAWCLLTDKSKRIECDQKWKSIFAEVQERPSPSVPTSENRAQNLASNNNLNARNLKRPSSSRSSCPRLRSKPNTFWTQCSTCKLNYEYRIACLNVNILCPCCHEPFLANELSSPPLNAQNFSTKWSSFKRQLDESLGREPDSSTTTSSSESSSDDI